MLDIDFIRSDMTEIVADLPVACTHRGQTFEATSSDFGMSRAVEIDGVIVDVDRQIVCDSANLPEGVVASDPITVDGSAYRILNLSEHQDGVGIEINLKAATR